MAALTDMISALYDAVAALLHRTPASVVQLSWPGLSLSPADFRAAATPQGPYDPQVAEETLSSLADMVPAASELVFEYSGFDLHSVYEALVFGAIPPASAPNAPVNPTAKLFYDAQFEFVMSAKGGADGGEYYPCHATPTDWYDTAGSWSSFTLGASTAPKATPASPFVKLGGPQLVAQRLLRVAPPTVDPAQLRSRLDANLAGRRALHPPVGAATPVHLPVGAATPVHPAVVAPLRGVAVGPATGLTARGPVPIPPPPSAGNPLLALRAQRSAALASTGARAALQQSLAQFNAQPALKRAIPLPPQMAAVAAPPATAIDPKTLRITSTRLELPVARRLALENLLVQDLPGATVQQTPPAWNISFQYRVVNLARPWLSTSVLSLPGWFFPGAKARWFSAGDGTAAPQLPFLTYAMLVIRDLRISANWTSADANALASSVAFGPFDLRAKSMAANEIRVDGLQILAWLAHRAPPLAPAGDPTIT